MTIKRFRAYDADGEVLAEGKTDGNTATFECEGKVDRVVFYSGAQASESVAGQVEHVNQTGRMAIELPAEDE